MCESYNNAISVLQYFRHRLLPAMLPERRFILMLEDDADDRELTQSIFAENNYDIGIEFLACDDDVVGYLEERNAQRKHLPALILIDKYIRAGESCSILDAIKSDKRFSHIPVVMISGSDLPSDIEECYRLGANSYIVKPSYNDLTVRKIVTFVNYWFQVAELPYTMATAVAEGMRQ